MDSSFKERRNRLSIFRQWRSKKETNLSRDIPDNVFMTCTNCHASIPTMDLIQHHYVCPRCHHPFRITARERIREIADLNTFRELDAKLHSNDVEHFPGYREKLEKTMQKTGMKEAVITGTARIDGHRCAMAVMDANFFMGSMSSAVGEKITRAIEYATKKKLPVLIFTTSGGARMQEGISSLMQMAKTSAAMNRHRESGNLAITILTNPTTGGVSASFAMLGDIILAEPYAMVGFAGKRVIENTIRETLPDNFQSAEFVLEKGFIDRIVPREKMKHELGTLLAMHEGGH